MVIGSYKSTGLLGSDQAIMDGPGWYGGITIITNGSDDATVILYDDPDNADGIEIDKFVVPAADRIGGAREALPVRCNNGLWLDIDENSDCIVRYQPQKITPEE